MLRNATLQVESYWNTCKKKFKDLRGFRRFLIQGYIDEFMWRKNNNLSRHDAFEKIIMEIAKLFPSQAADDKIKELNDSFEK